MVGGYILTLDGCPYAFGTAGITALPTSSDQDWATTWTLAADTLEWFSRTLVQGAVPIEGRAVAAQCSFLVHDKPMTAGPAAGHNLMSWLATRLPNNIVSTQLSANILATDHTITVDDATRFDPFPRVIHMEREAIYCGSRVGNVIAVVSVPEGRGYYGSRAVAHMIDTQLSAAVRPEVWGDFPWVSKRRAILWRVNAAGVATPKWRGYASRSPRLSPDGAKFEIQCEDVWKYHSTQMLGLPNAVTRLRGFNVGALKLGAVVTPVGGGIPTTMVTDIWVSSDSVRSTIDDLFLDAIARLTALFVSNSIAGTPEYYSDGSTLGFRCTVSSVGSLSIWAQLGDQYSSASGVLTAANTWRADLQLGDIPGSLVIIDSAIQRDIPVTATNDIPTSWPTTFLPSPPNSSLVDGICITQMSQVLRGEYDADTNLTVNASSTSVVNATVTGSARLDQKQPRYIPHTSRTWRFVSRNTFLRLTAHVKSDHFIYGLRHVIEDPLGIIQSGADPRDWDWSTAGRVESLASVSSAAREWYLDGTQRLGDIVTDACTVLGYSVAVRSSRLAIIAFQPPLPTDTVVATIGTTDMVPGVAPLWTALPDGLVNAATISSDVVKLTVRDGRSIGRYGQARTIDVELTGAPIDRAMLEQPRELANQLMSRTIALWSEPTQTGTIALPLTVWEDVIQPGDYIRLTEWLMPSGSGGRGWNDVCQVLTCGADHKKNQLVLTLLLYARSGLAGYAPSARVGSISSGSPSTIFLAAPGYVLNASDYAGSDLPGYRGIASDGGCSFYNVGDKIELLLKNSTTAARFICTIIATNPAAGVRSITVTETIPIAGPNWPAQATAGNVDVRQAPYQTAGLQAGQKQYGEVGSNSTLTIGGTSDTAKYWSP